jgi:glycosyltransferase involved in cell wall biosynthesis
MNPKISVIIPVYNGEDWLRPCMRSVLGQRGAEFELLVGDDFSLDSSREIISSFDNDSRVRGFFFDRNVGLFGNLNRLLGKARTPLVRFLCQDDILEPNCLADEVAFFESHPDIVMSICSVRLIDTEDNVIGEWGAGPNVFPTKTCLQLLLYHGCIAGNLSTVTARLKAIDRVGRFDESFSVAGDYEMWVRLCQVGNVADRYERLVRLREHGDRLSHAVTSGVRFVEEGRRIRAEILRLLPQVVQRRAKKYTYWRHNVLETHYLLRCLMAGRLDQCASLMRIMGARDLVAGVMLWLVTLNNHLYQPQPIFYSDPGNHRESSCQ